MWILVLFTDVGTIKGIKNDCEKYKITYFFPKVSEHLC